MYWYFMNTKEAFSKVLGRKFCMIICEICVLFWKKRKKYN